MSPTGTTCAFCEERLRDHVRGQSVFLCPECSSLLRGGQGRSGADTFRLGEALAVLAVVAALLLGVVLALAQRDQKPLEPVVGGRP